jgi:N-acetylmuramoyl-L-alanine amidase
MPAVLVESGYMSNSAEGKNLYDADYRKKIAKAIGEGISAYKKAVERP